MFVELSDSLQRLLYNVVAVIKSIYFTEIS